MNLLVPHGFEANYVVGFARGLAANAVPFTVLSSDDTTDSLASAGIDCRNLRGSQNLSRSTLSKAANLARYYILLFWTVFRARGGTIHFNGLLNSKIIFFDGLLLPVWFWLWAGRYIHTAHNALPHGREKSLLFRWAYQWIYRFPHFIVAHTQKVARQLETEFGVKPERIKVISIGLNEEIPDTTLSVESARRQLGIEGNGPVALFFEKIDRYKGVDILVQAWSQVKTADARLVITGWCPDAGYAEEVRGAIAGSPRTLTMEWREGFVPNELVAVWLRACDVVVMPYRHIYQSGVVFLCLRFGMPIVATDVGSLAEYIDSDSGVIATRNDPTGLAEALDRFFQTKTRFVRENIAQQAAKYSWDRQCQTIKHLYE